MKRTFILPWFYKTGNPFSVMAKADNFAKANGAKPIRLKPLEMWRFKDLLESAGSCFLGRKPRNWRKYITAWLFEIEETNTSSYAVDIVEKWLSMDPNSRFNPGYACACLCSVPETAYEYI